MSTRDKNDIKALIKDIVRDEMQDMAARGTFALLADCMGGGGSAYAVEQCYEAIRMTNLVAEISRKIDQKPALVKICVLEMIGSA